MLGEAEAMPIVQIARFTKRGGTQQEIVPGKSWFKGCLHAGAACLVKVDEDVAARVTNYHGSTRAETKILLD